MSHVFLTALPYDVTSVIFVAMTFKWHKLPLLTVLGLVRNRSTIKVNFVYHLNGKEILKLIDKSFWLSVCSNRAKLLQNRKTFCCLESEY